MFKVDVELGRTRLTVLENSANEIIRLTDSALSELRQHNVGFATHILNELKHQVIKDKYQLETLLGLRESIE